MRVDYCQACGKKSKLHFHHIIPKSLDGSDSDDNILTLCTKHHAQIHGNKAKWSSGALIKKALAKKKAAGEVSGTIPYGYRCEGDMVVPDEKEQGVLRLVKQLMDTGMGLRKIARHLEALGITNRRGHSKWSNGSTGKLMKNASKLPDR